MEDNTEGLDLLIKQKKRRPNYARIISMEFSKAESAPRSKKKTSVKTADGEACLQLDDKRTDEDSDGSEYYSAEEFFLSSSSSSISTDEESLDKSSDSVFQSLESSFNSNISISGTGSQNESLKLNTAAKAPEVRHRAPSKKQKRKRRQSSNIEPILPFWQGDILDIEVNDLLEDANEPNILKPVPSLVELCINASKHLAKTHSNLNVPKSVRQILQIGISAHSFCQLQLENLFHVLELSTLTNRYSSGSRKHAQLNIPGRSIWSLDNGINMAQGYSSTMYLPFMFDTELVDQQLTQNANLPVELINIYRGKQLSALAHVIDLLLPALISWKKSTRKRHKSETEGLSAETDFHIKKIKNIIQNRCCRKDKAGRNNGNLEDKVFDLVLPYVFWSRGDIRKASQCFLTIVEKEPRVRYKAMYLYEAGRMFSHFEDSESATRYFCLSVDALYMKEKHKKDNIVSELNRQTRLLCAAVQDIGLLSYQKAEKSKSLWMSAISVPFVAPNSITCFGSVMAVDSLLCYYGAYWHENVGSVYEEAVRLLSTLVSTNEDLYLYLSMMYALLGKGDQSSMMFKRFSAQYSSSSGPAPGSKLSTDRNRWKPWQPLVDKVIEQGQPPAPIKVIWRTQLVPPTCTDSFLKDFHVNPKEADNCNRNLNLCISESGFLTGDMQMVLPPMRSIYLDLYTGKLNLKTIPSATEPWKSYESQSLKCVYSNSHALEKGAKSILPTLTELYKGHYGETVHMLHTNLYNTIEEMPTMITFNPNICHLVWTGADGQKVKINVYYRLRWFIAEQWHKTLSETAEINTEIIRLTGKYITRGWDFQTDSRRIINNAKQNCERKQIKDKKMKKKHLPEVNFSTFSVLDYCTFNRGLVLALKFNCLATYLMVLNCTSKDLFRKPVFVKMSPSFISFVKQTPMMAKSSDCFSVYAKDNSSGFYTYDLHGELINDKTVTNIIDPTGESQMDPITHHSTLYFLKQNKMLSSNCNGFHSEADFLGELFGIGSIADIIVVITCQGSVKLIDLPSMLPLEPELILNKSFDASIWDQDNLRLKSTINFTTFKVIGESRFTDTNGKTYTRGGIAIDNLLLIVKVQRNSYDDDAKVTVTQVLTLAGFPKEIHFINETVGFLLTVTQSTRTNHLYRENLYFVSHTGQFKQVLLSLGPGPRSFLTAYLPANSDHDFVDPDHGKEGYRVYMRDGYSGIICALLE